MIYAATPQINLVKKFSFIKEHYMGFGKGSFILSWMVCKTLSLLTFKVLMNNDIDLKLFSFLILFVFRTLFSSTSFSLLMRQTTVL